MRATCSIAITSRPVLGLIEPLAEDPNKAHFTLRKDMEALATVTFADKGPFTPGWSIGWVQTLSFNNWAIYRGTSKAQGSVLLQIGSRSAALSTLFDGEQAGLPFVYSLNKTEPSLVGGSLPYAVSLPNGPVAGPSIKLMMQDEPTFFRHYQTKNAKTGVVNFLHEARVELDYCAAVALRDPAGKFTLLAGVYWSVIWAYHAPAGPTPPAAIPASSGSRAQVGRIFQGSPPDARVAALLVGPHTPTYNDLFAPDPEGDRQESKEWPTWSVRR